MKQKIIRIATRQSPLALWQANFVKDKLLTHWPNLHIELLPMTTSGDKFLKDKLLEKGGKGLFVKELEDALLDKRADLAVHSTKDMPAHFPEGLSLTAICKRENPFDAMVSTQYKNLDSLPHQAVIGTSSLRRQSQLLAYRPDLTIKTLRGNINTRLAKLETGEFQAIILAAAGLERMRLNDKIQEILSEQIMLPACGQGALCIESRSEDEDIQRIVSVLNDPVSALCVQTERMVNAQLGGNCHVPLAVYCTSSERNQLDLRAKLLSVDGQQVICNAQSGSHEQAAYLAKQCSQALIEQGAIHLLSMVSS